MNTRNGEAKQEMVGNTTLPEVLGDVTYPAEKWQIITCAEIYGADVHTRRELYKLPPRVYQSVADIADTLDLPAAV
jgi:Protein of unknown function (DUF2795)